MNTRAEVLYLYPAAHPSVDVRQGGFTLDHTYLERCWAPLIGPSSVALLRHCVWHWIDQAPARIDAADLAAEIGLGRGTGSSSPLWHTIDRVVQFNFAEHGATDSELRVYTQFPPVAPHNLSRLPIWARGQHEKLLAARLAVQQAAAERPATPLTEPNAAARMADRLTHLDQTRSTRVTSLGR